jgi:hypothetical protein
MAFKHVNTETTEWHCPLENKDIWQSTWQYPHKSNMSLLSPAQMYDTFIHFAEAAAAMQQMSNTRSIRHLPILRSIGYLPNWTPTNLLLCRMANQYFSCNTASTRRAAYEEPKSTLAASQEG